MPNSKRALVYKNVILVIAFVVAIMQTACAQSPEMNERADGVATHDSATVVRNVTAASTSYTLAKRIAGVFDKIKRGNEERMILDLPHDNARRFREGETMILTIAYEPRPIGGILRITASLLPAFAGIGDTSRPIATKDFAEAVDGLDIDDLATKAADLIQQLRNEFSGATAQRTEAGRAN